MIDGLHDPFHLRLVVRVILVNGGHQQFHEHVIDLLGLHSLKCQMEVTHHLARRPPVQLLPLRQEVVEKCLDGDVSRWQITTRAIKAFYYTRWEAQTRHLPMTKADKLW